MLVKECPNNKIHRRFQPKPGDCLGGCGRGIDSDDKVARHARAQQPDRTRIRTSVCTDAEILEKTGIFRLGVDNSPSSILIALILRIADGTGRKQSYNVVHAEEDN